MSVTIAYASEAGPQEPQHARIDDLLTERSTLAIPRLGHNAQADLLRKQQVLGSNPSVGSTPSFRDQEDPLSKRWHGLRFRRRLGAELLTGEDLLTGRVSDINEADPVRPAWHRAGEQPG
jgi:hypothetical protein